MKKDEKGMMVVEALISFTAFILVCIGIVFMIKIFMLHNRVQYAINAAARELSTYTYIYDALGLRDAERRVSADGKESNKKIDDAADKVIQTVTSVQEVLSNTKSTQGAISNATSGNLSGSEIEDVLDNAGSLADSVDKTVESGKEAINSLKQIDLSDLMKSIVSIGLRKIGDEARSQAASRLAKLLTEKYLETAQMDADTYLRSYGVEGLEALDFGDTTMFSDEDFRVVDIVVKYDIDISFLGFVLENTTIHAVQRVSVAGWCGGDNQKITEQGKLYSVSLFD